MDNGFNVRDEFKDMEDFQIKEIADKNTNPFSVCILNVTGGLNISTIIRTAHNFGVERVFIVGRTRFDRRGMVGAQNYTDIIKIEAMDGDEIDDIVFEDTLVEHKLFPVYVESGGIPLDEFNWKHCLNNRTLKPCLVFGNENSGIPQDFLDDAEILGDPVVSIPQKGVMRSFNVASAASIVMWDMVKEMGWT